MAKLYQFSLLLWKNFLLQRRKVVVTLFEIGLPTIATMILILIRQRVSSTPVPYPTEWPEYNVTELPLRPPDHFAWKVAYTPDNTLMQEIMSDVSLAIGVNVEGMGFENEAQLVSNMTALTKSAESILAGVVFLNAEQNLTEQITYKIRMPSLLRSSVNKEARKLGIEKVKNWRTKEMFPIFQSVGPRENDSDYGKDPGYYEEGFLTLQMAVDNAIIRSVNASFNPENISVLMRRFPYPPYNDDLFVVVIQQQLSFILMLSYVFLALNVVKNVVHEKERKLKESMKMMGLSNWLHWTAWFVLYMVMMIISIIIITFFLCIKVGDRGSVVDNSDPTVIFVFLLLYAVSTIAFCFAVSVFFNRAISGAAAGGILFFLSYLPYSILQPRYETLTLTDKILPCLLNNVAMSLGGQVIGMFEGTGEGVQWNNIHRGATVDDSFSLFIVMMMLVIDSVLYCIIAWYVEAVFPGEYGFAKPWYFFLTKAYWCGVSQNMEDEESVPLLSQGLKQRHGDIFERDPSDIRAGIQVRNLKKEFGSGSSKKVAVNGITLNMYDGQITALLGHNGAGKTTTMFMLTGFIPPTGGTAIVNGYDILKDISSVRSSLGLCPQHDVLFDMLTVEEHLTFFCKLKGFPKKRVKDEVERMLQAIGLNEKRNALSKTLSGGMKRKLSVGIALIGDSKIVMLDEPTSGMDPNARRHTWDLLQKHRAGRTMVLTTHFMDEADLLGDRIAIMADGVVKCCGSSLFLKKKYGAGYHMVIVKQDGCKVSNISSVVKAYVPEAELESNIGKELSYILPDKSSGQFEELFSELESRRSELGIASYGASVTTMEEVFVKVGEGSDVTVKEKLTGIQNGEAATYDYRTMSSDSISPVRNGNAAHASTLGQFVVGSSTNSAEYTEFDHSADYNHGIVLYLQQFYAMFMKRVLHTMRNKVLAIAQLAVPLVFTIFALAVIKTLPPPGDSPPLPLNGTKLGENVVVYSIGAHHTALAAELGKTYQSQFNDKHTRVVRVNDQPHYKTDPSLEKYLVECGEESISRYNNHYLIGAEFDNLTAAPNTTKASAYFNNQAYHTPGIALNSLTNSFLRYFGHNESLITTINHPLPRSIREQVDDEGLQIAIGFTVSFNVLFGMAFLASSFVLFLIKERALKVKHCQFAAGVSSFTFWFATFCWDFINYLIPCFLLLVVFAAFGVEGYIEPDRLPIMLLLFFLYGWAMLPFMYLLSYMFTVPASGLVWLSIFNIFSGVITVLAVQILSIPELNTEDIAKAIEWICAVIIPSFDLGQGLNTFYTNYQYVKICTNEEVQTLCKLIPYFINISNPCCKGKCGDNCIDYQENYLSFEEGGIGRMLLFLAIQGCLFIAILFMSESDFFHRYWSNVQAKKKKLVFTARQSSITSTHIEEDEDVVKERFRISNTDVSILKQSNALIMRDLTKYYGNLLAVEGINVGIPQGECFGLLGINGAGKTTTFKMLTGDEAISSGIAVLDGYDVKSNITMVQRRLGYCPQFDALIDQMTGREMLFMYARLRGVKSCLIPLTVSKLITSLTLDEYADKLVSAYSGGNKRKLSTAIALIGDPPIVFLDEPTTGMDPVAKRFLWDALSHYRAQGKTLVLTSHSMEECEALCTRVAIMVNGQFKCLGSPQHLKNKFGEGYTLIAKVAYSEQVESNLQSFMEFIERTFPGSHLKDIHQGLVHYHITDTTLSWAMIFGTLERAKVTYNLEDYSVSQTTLEQVFINFARSQIPPHEEEKTGCCNKCCGLLSYCCCCSCECCTHNNNEVLD